ncbi:MAG: NAD(P)/FAD-dependent oxidoreductase [Tannerellaceae bacterium]|nr:NAD(P)/FAD-dependent oxidoreductase [Tannerellaceae bacterium]
MEEIVYRPGITPWELVTPDTVKRVSEFIYSIRNKVRNRIHNPHLQQILEFPVLFLGAKPQNTPAFYSFMNHADMKLGTWHVRGGLYQVIKGMRQLAESLGVRIHTSSPIKQLITHKNRVTGIQFDDYTMATDLVISSADYHHTETLLDTPYRNYTEEYWQNRVMAPSALLYYIGFNKKLKNISHHTLFFDASFDRHAEKIYDTPEWPKKPLFYASFPTQTDATMGSEGKESAVILIPLAAGLKETPEVKEMYFKEIINRMEIVTGQSLREDILFYESFGCKDFIREYNAYKGNAYGLANTLLQTAFLKPKIFNRKLKNLFYTGQLTVPGPGIPPAVISGKIAAGQALKYLQKSDDVWISFTIMFHLKPAVW